MRDFSPYLCIYCPIALGPRQAGPSAIGRAFVQFAPAKWAHASRPGRAGRAHVLLGARRVGPSRHLRAGFELGSGLGMRVTNHLPAWQSNFSTSLTLVDLFRAHRSRGNRTIVRTCERGGLAIWCALLQQGVFVIIFQFDCEGCRQSRGIPGSWSDRPISAYESLALALAGFSPATGKLVDPLLARRLARFVGPTRGEWLRATLANVIRKFSTELGPGARSPKLSPEHPIELAASSAAGQREVFADLREPRVRLLMLLLFLSLPRLLCGRRRLFSACLPIPWANSRELICCLSPARPPPFIASARAGHSRWPSPSGPALRWRRPSGRGLAGRDMGPIRADTNGDPPRNMQILGGPDWLRAQLICNKSAGEREIFPMQLGAPSPPLAG